MFALETFGKNACLLFSSIILKSLLIFDELVVPLMLFRALLSPICLQMRVKNNCSLKLPYRGNENIEGFLYPGSIFTLG